MSQKTDFKIINTVDIDLLVPFENHPFKKRSGIEQQELTQSIKENRLLKPIIVRPFLDGKYEIISGHRRVETCKALGITSIPVTIKEPTKDEAIVQMVDSNIHREHILPSEKAFAYKMKPEALKHQGKCLNCGKGRNFWLRMRKPLPSCLLKRPIKSF